LIDHFPAKFNEIQLRVQKNKTKLLAVLSKDAVHSRNSPFKHWSYMYLPTEGAGQLQM